MSAVVLLPHVPRWRTLADPLPEVAQLLVEPAELLPRSVRAYAAALRELAAAVAASGRLRGAPGPRGAVAGQDRVRATPGREHPRGTAPAAPVVPRAAAVPGMTAAAVPARAVAALPGAAAPVVPGRAAVPGAPATGARPPVVGSFRPVVGSVARATPAVEPPAPGPGEQVRRVRGVRIVPVVPRPRVSGERIEQVG